ncbi:Uncharacterised protein [Mycobacteroides abscessus subsp. abscessus]|nr:Uncharacterised protein [Mycobacteroides abscessus subsp. abscessus]
MAGGAAAGGRGAGEDVGDGGGEGGGVVVGDGAAVGGDDVGEGRGAAGDDGGARGEGFEGGQPEGFVRAGGEGDVGGGEQGGDPVAVGDEAGEVDGGPAVGQGGHAAGAFLQRVAARSVAGDDQADRCTGPVEFADGLDAAVDAFLHRQPSAVHQQRVAGCGEVGAQAAVAAAGAEQVEVDAQRHQFHVGRADAAEFGAGEFGGAHDDVVSGGPAGRAVSDRAAGRGVRGRSSRRPRRGGGPSGRSRAG